MTKRKSTKKTTKTAKPIPSISRENEKADNHKLFGQLLTMMRDYKNVYPGTADHRIDFDDEEIATLIDFHESMARDADESGEHTEAKRRRQRAKDLRSIAVR